MEPYTATPNHNLSSQSFSSMLSRFSGTSAFCTSSGTASPDSVWSSVSSTSSSQESPTSLLSSHNGFFGKVTRNELPIVAIIGIGYVGLHLVTEFSKHYKVIAYDLSTKRIATVAEQFRQDSSIYFTSEPSSLSSATHFLVAVPTPLIPNTIEIDTSIVRKALATICEYVRPGATIIIESSVSVGLTRSLLSNMIGKHDLYAGMSPERVDPGRIEPSYETIPKIISGLDDIAPGSSTRIQDLYSKVFFTLVIVSSPEVAEMTKLYENCQRMMCVAYANEMADACVAVGIDPFEVSRAAATKPFGYLPFTPSAGVGGHCIPVNPSYLFSTSNFPLLKHATETMKARPARLADRLLQQLSERNKGRSGPQNRMKILVVGVAFKPGEELIANSPGVGIIDHLLKTSNTHISFVDPLVKKEALPYVYKMDEKTEWNKICLMEFDSIVVVIKQVGLDFDVLKSLDTVLIQKYCQ